MAYEEELKNLKELFDLPYQKAKLYLDFINEKGLVNEFDKWQKGKLLLVV